MSTESHAIDPTTFAEAIADLPLSAVYSKVSEIRNSIAHLHRSNDELRHFLAESKDSEEDKKELEGYILENEGVVTLMNERISLLRDEVERRGQTWLETREKEGVNGEQVSEGIDTATVDSNVDAGQEEEGVYL